MGGWGRLRGEGWRGWRLNLHHFKVLFPGAAFRACPVDGDVFPSRPGREVFFGRAFLLFVEPPANLTDKGAVRFFVLAHDTADSTTLPANFKISELKIPERSGGRAGRRAVCAGLCRSILVPVGGCTPDRNDPPPLNTRPQFQIRKASPKINLLTVFCPLFLCPRVGGSFRSGVQPPTGIERKAPPTPNTSLQFQIRKSIPRNESSNCFLSSVPLLSRGWIIPVGGSTPDRLKVWGDNPRPA